MDEIGYCLESKVPNSFNFWAFIVNFNSAGVLIVNDQGRGRVRCCFFLDSDQTNLPIPRGLHHNRMGDFFSLAAINTAVDTFVKLNE